MMLSDFPPVTAQLTVPDTDAAVRFYREAFGADELVRSTTLDGERVMHCELLLNGARLLLYDEFPEHGHRSPAGLGGTPVTLHLYVSDVDAVVASAVAAGATLELPVQDAFWGDRYGILLDPAGHRWSVATPRDDPSPEELRARGADFAAAKRVGEAGGATGNSREPRGYVGEATPK